MRAAMTDDEFVKLMIHYAAFYDVSCTKRSTVTHAHNLTVTLSLLSMSGARSGAGSVERTGARSAASAVWA